MHELNNFQFCDIHVNLLNRLQSYNTRQFDKIKGMNMSYEKVFGTGVTKQQNN